MFIKRSVTRFIVYSIVLHLLFISACKNDSGLEHALAFAKSNRKEIEKVLEHYRKDPADSLKYKAACFLISNMPEYWFYEGDQLTTFRKSLYDTAMKYNGDGKEAFKRLEAKYGALDLQRCKRVYDLQVVTADYLIRNIELSFRSWKERPWGKYISFEDFCEEILPYRIAHEPLENWRQQYYDTFRVVLDSLPAECKEDPITACQMLCNRLRQKRWIFYQFNPVQGMGANNLLNNRFGNCDDRGELITYAMRALGIPGGVDLVLQYPNRMYGHSWNYVRDTTGRTIDFDLYERLPGTPPAIAWKKGRVYRKCFGIQNGSLPGQTDETELPPGLNNKFLKDVSAIYFTGANLTITPDPEKAKADIVYLSTFNNTDWVPATWSKEQGTKVTFKDVDNGIVYLPSSWADGSVAPVAYPVWIDSSAVPHSFIPDRKNTQVLKLTRKYPIQPWWDWYSKRPLNGKFQVADNSRFKNPVTLYTITDELDMRWHHRDTTLSKNYRYFRYLSGTNGYCNIAEVKVYSGDSILTGKVIGTPGSYGDDPAYSRKAVFDGNPLTFYDATDSSSAWAGLDLGKPVNVTGFSYLFRNDDNNIRIGDDYELFYWDNEWISLGRQKATDSELIFKNCPVNALFLLHNSSRGTEERIFSYENNTQVWW